MGRSFFKLLDFLLDYWDQVIWWVPGVALITGWVMGGWAALSALYAVEIVTITLVTTAAMLALLTLLPQYLRQRFPRPFAVSVSTVLTEGEDHPYNVKVDLRIINRSRTDPLILEFALCFRQADGQEQWSHHPELSDMPTQVKPQQEVHGAIAFFMESFGDFIPTAPHGVYLYDGTLQTAATSVRKDTPGGIFLHITDRWSGRDKLFRIPGSYPPGYFAPPVFISSGIS